LLASVGSELLLDAARAISDSLVELEYLVDGRAELFH
jgi:hypothetical protein